MVTASGATGTFTIGGPAVAVNPGVTVGAADTDLTGATVAISPDTLQAGDLLNFTNQNGISGSYNGASGVLTLSGTATVGQYQAALQSVTFSTTSAIADTRAISIVVVNGSLISDSAAESVNVIAAPVVTPSGIINSFEIGGSAVAVDPWVQAFGRLRFDGQNRHYLGRHTASGRHAQFHEPEWHHRQLFRRRADLERQCDTGSVSDGPAVDHVLDDQHDHRAQGNFDRRREQ